MIVISLARCPPSLRGDMTKWFFEISTNVFVGIVSARVRDGIWQRIINTCKSGRAIMVFKTNNEQGFDFRVHNGEWSPVDLDGFKIMKRPLPNKETELKTGYSKASIYRKAKRIKSTMCNQESIKTFAYFMINRTEEGEREIVKIEALDVEDGTISNENLWTFDEDNEINKRTLVDFFDHISDKTLIVENPRRFLHIMEKTCADLDIEMKIDEMENISHIAKNKLYELRRYDFKTLKRHFKISCNSDTYSKPRAMIKIYEKLMKID